MKIEIEAQENLTIVSKRCIVVLGWVPDSSDLQIVIKYNEEESSVERHPTPVLFESPTSRSVALFTIKEKGIG